MAEPFTIYKMTILYMLERCGFPLSNTQLSNFFLEKEYTDYFRIQEVIANLVDAKLIEPHSSHSNTQYTLTAAGKETLGFFRDKITEGIDEDIRSYFDQNKWEFKKDNSVTADYRRGRNQKYEVRCQVKNDGACVLDITLAVNTKEQAEAICAQWKKSHEDVYAYLMDTLMK